MPFKDKEKRKIYLRNWARNRYEKMKSSGMCLKEIGYYKEKKCLLCGKIFYARKKQQCCSRKCAVQLQLRKGIHNSFPKWKHSPNYKGGTINNHGYRVIIFNQKPIPEHRWMMEQHLKRKLNSWEEVHHKNRIKTDNRIENLEIVLKTHHNGLIVCPHCQKSFKAK